MIDLINESSQKECIHFCINYKFKELNHPCNKSYNQDIFSVSNNCVKIFTQSSSIHDLCFVLCDAVHFHTI